ncbi:MAG TPA: threonylcarbamoyl-AMP synthase [Candidatus Bathyarchaeota archaeon]|nr:threonylcarbamoyl-AMP synthase [Candidatus Bathyarchaeota archaeon]
MELRRLPRLLPAGEEAIKEASRIVRAGGLIIYPTDTVYGLGCDPLNPRAVERVFRVKGRRGKPLPILVSSMGQAKRIAQFTPKAEKLAKAFWPGALTLVLRRRPTLPEITTCGLNSVGVRAPGHSFCLRLIEACGGLLVGTSANKSGETPPRTAEEADLQIGAGVDLIIDGGPTPGGVPSTVVDLTGEEPRLIRQGPVKFEEVVRVLHT